MTFDSPVTTPLLKVTHTNSTHTVYLCVYVVRLFLTLLPVAVEAVRRYRQPSHYISCSRPDFLKVYTVRGRASAQQVPTHSLRLFVTEWNFVISRGFAATCHLRSTDSNRGASDIQGQVQGRGYLPSYPQSRSFWGVL